MFKLVKKDYEDSLDTVFHSKQKKTKDHQKVAGVAIAATMAKKECQHQFRNRRWNCSTTTQYSTSSSG